MALTLYMSVSIGFASFCVGLLFATATLMPYRPLHWLARGLSIGIRGVPALAFLFWMYFLVPRLLQVNLSPFQSAGLALMLYHGAYMGEDIRGGIQAVPKGQWEAARASGLGFLALMQYVILPQAIRAVVPALINRIVDLFMYTSAVSVLGILEFTRAGILVNKSRAHLFVAGIRVCGSCVFRLLLSSLAVWAVPGKPLELGTEDRSTAYRSLTTSLG